MNPRAGCATASPMTCGCGLLTKGRCPGNLCGGCPLTLMRCSPAALGAGRALVKERLLDAWRHLRGANLPLVVGKPGTLVQPVHGFDAGWRAHLAKEAAHWFRIYVRPAVQRGEIADADSRCLGEWLSTQAGLTDNSLNFYLNERAGLDPTERLRVKKAFYRSANRALRALMLGLVADRVFVVPLEWRPPGQNAALQQDKNGWHVSQDQRDTPAQQADHGRARGHHDSTS